ncbi:MAG: ADP-glyceromanno-heptose 6-epimerase [Omnitrophica bacterium]|nr:ADP-glyceromanno-heptose 6-epimerase [Candidatus Omnitrophota bacterium]
MQRKMRVLVTGGAGFIGSSIVSVLEDKGVEVYVLDNFSHSDYKNLMKAKGEIICADILDEAVYKRLPELDAVIHAAAITDTTLTDDTKMMNVNFNGFKSVLNFCLDRKIKLVYASSAGVYGTGPSPMKEAQKLMPHNTYAYSKYLCDCLAQKVTNKKNSPLIVGLRYFNVYGFGEHHKQKSASMIYQLYLQMAEENRPRVFKYGEQKRDFIYVKDVARMTVEALNLKASTILNLGTGKARSFNDIISILNRLLKKNLKPDYFDNLYEGKYQDYTEADITHLRKTLGTTVYFSLEEGIKDYIKSYLSC